MILKGPNCHKIQTIIFDLDGVLLFPWRFQRYLEENHNWTIDQLLAFFKGDFVSCMRGENDLKTVLPAYLDRWGWTGTVDEFVNLWFEVENCVDERVLDLVQDVRKDGYGCCLATNQERYRAAYVREKMGLASSFDKMFFSCEMKFVKPERQYFDLVRSRLNVSAESLLFIDDSRKFVEGAREAGWQAIRYTTFDQLFEEDSKGSPRLYFSR